MEPFANWWKWLFPALLTDPGYFRVRREAARCLLGSGYASLWYRCCGLCSFHPGCEYGHATFFLSNVLRKQRAKLRRRWFFGFGVSFADRWLAGQVTSRSGDFLHKELHFYHIRNRSQDIKPECCISLYFAPTWPSLICSWFPCGVIRVRAIGARAYALM